MKSTKEKARDFLDVFKMLDEEDIASISEAIEDVLRLEKQVFNLRQSLSGLSADEMEKIYDEQSDFREEIRKEKEEVASADYGLEEDEEEMHRHCDLKDIEEREYEVLTQSYPAGIGILDEEIEELESGIINEIINAMSAQDEG